MRYVQHFLTAALNIRPISYVTLKFSFDNFCLQGNEKRVV